MRIYKDIEQGSDEWHALRLGRITGSGFSKLLGTSAAKEKYLYDRASEIVTGCRCDSDDFSSMHIQRGHEYESIAKSEYIVATFNHVEEVGIVELNEHIACSPDGLINNDGIIEIKVPDSNNYFRLILDISANGDKAIPKEHYMQMQFNMYICKRNWCDYVLYNPKHAVNNKGLFIYRVYAYPGAQETISETLDDCVLKLANLVERYNAATQESSQAIMYINIDRIPNAII